MKLPLTPAEKSFKGGQENFRFHKLVNLPENKSRTIKPIEPTPPFSPLRMPVMGEASAFSCMFR